MDAAKSVTATFVEYSVDCSSFAVYSPGSDPLITLSPVVPAKATVIVMHGKAGSPLYLSPLSSALANAGYDVIAPYLPWNDTVWDGSMCEAMNYIDGLAAQEAIMGNAVIIAGHSMGGAHALIYAATSPAAEVKGIVTLAPGHFPQLELPQLTVFDPFTAASITSSITKAEDMVANGNGDQLDTFDTLIPDPSAPLLQISATANDYLSYHALYQYPDINDVLPTIKLPVLWLAGNVDPLTDFYDMPALFSRITSQNSIYQVISGDHLGMVSNSAAPIVDWMPLLGL
jgi:pimeloyl-ACP methyl ester carboxylesterase